MKFLKKLAAAGAASLLALSIAVTTGLAHVSAQSCYTVDATGAGVTSATPVFNNICNAPFGVGNEADFVRVRANTNGNDMDNQNNDVYSNILTSACTTNTAFDVWNYIHNDASQDFNDNGNGSAVAKDVKLALSAPLGQTQNSFSFGGKVTASNAASVSDTATLNCNAGKTVKLTLVPSSVHTYSPSYGWKDLGDGSVNSTFAIGSPNVGSGIQYGCWNYRVIVVYQVKVTEVQTPPVTPVYTCDLFTLTADTNRLAKVTQFSYTAKNATFNGVDLNWGDNSAVVSVNGAGQVVNQTHQYAQDNSTVTRTVTATVKFTVNDKAATATCVAKVSFNGTTPPTITTVTTPPKPTSLVNTGAGSVMGLFAAAMAAGTIGYRWLLGRRLAE